MCHPTRYTAVLCFVLFGITCPAFSVGQASAKSPQQTIQYVAADVSTFEGAKKAIEKCSAVPDTVFCCAGGAKPGFFLEQTESDFEKGMKTDYWTCLATAHVSFSHSVLRVAADANSLSR